MNIDDIVHWFRLIINSRNIFINLSTTTEKRIEKKNKINERFQGEYSFPQRVLKHH